ncbi:lysophospholipid acyltransferase family protein [Chitinivorax sp. B]|uniref:lysophospholipid acyltransferase family protein n=1 Tax=Chitinivorax sp. B TaxID=2502235 RepID=UPI0010F90196|nr:lysophospholipid acyltransferase family protein [Chitinivorax sp. B]
MKRLLRIAFMVLVAYPVVLIVLGVSIRHRERIPRRGPAVLVANHNSHLDTLTLLTLFPLSMIHKVRPVAAADYFLKSGPMAWFSLNVIGIIPIVRGGAQQGIDPLQPCYDALDRGEILLIFPEGTRGEPEQLAELKSGVSFIAKRYPAVPIVPAYTHGLGKSMPKGSFMLVPHFCRLAIGKPLFWSGDKEQFMNTLRQSFNHLRERVCPPEFISNGDQT